MPVLEILSQAIKLGSKFMPLTADQYSLMQIGGQAVMALCALQPMAPIPIPVIPMGAPAAMVLSKLVALPGEITKMISDVIRQAVELYSKQLNDAQAKRKAALEKLYADLNKAKAKAVGAVKTGEDEIAALRVQLALVQADQTLQLSKYQAILFTCKQGILSAKAAGDQATEDSLMQKIDDMNPWLDHILMMVVAIVNLKVDIINKTILLEDNKDIAATQVAKDWLYMNSIATTFGVAIPFYPDLPQMPTLPALPRMPEMPPLVRTTQQAFAKWLTTPSIPPLGIVLSAIMLMIMQMVPNSIPTAAQLEAQADSMLLAGAGCL